MTPDEIIQAANERYVLPKKACKQEKRLINHLREKFIEKKMKEYGHIKVNS